MQIHQLLTPYNYNSGQLSRIKYIVIHYVGATGGAEANCKYYAGGRVGASAHYFVGFQGEIWQSVEDKNIAWHCGAKVYKHPECRNGNSIGIELCVRNRGSQADTSRDWYFEDSTVESATMLTRELMKKYRIPAECVLRHYDVTGKICPNPFVYNHTKHTWEEFKTALAASEPAITGWEGDTQGKYRYRKPDGQYAANEWQLINHHWYMFAADGHMLTGWQKWNGRIVSREEPGDWYYFDETPGGSLEGACWHERPGGYGAWEIWEVK
ncbi:N-acetylmuramoyl-L-alanine amidase [[Clostridium] symbiosum]|uniref:peptidoglycan recognition protein family protein n=1 Tax=Clostridium symbiosum TaxID=1512 RepID=UPI001D087E65|nr:N-acetylmuramoyl-L-alanine amidase [[Clostridium] symbiosum]MCB6610422.1 N-acetylmuramoyl-L-alanine amidase [[Clostridium] symbiosum]MCB6931607.1 N-acetylmuramoyl-L-alanine amidase [[Clostridium] symbiosum]